MESIGRRKEEEKMIVDNHCKGSRRSHRKEKENAKENGMRKNQEDIDGEKDEIKF